MRQKKREVLLDDVQWSVLAPLFPEPKRRKDGRGRPWSSNRSCVEGYCGFCGQEPDGAIYPNSTRTVQPAGAGCGCGKRKEFGWQPGKAIVDAGPAPIAGLGRSLSRRHVHHGEKGGSAVGKTRRGKGTKCMVVVDGQGVPVGVQLASAQIAECRLAESTLQQVKVPRVGRGRPRSHLRRVIADRGYDSDALRARFKHVERN